MFVVAETKCEFAVNPLGIGTRRPRFSWTLIGGEPGDTAGSYRVQVASTLEKLVRDPDLWDSGVSPPRPAPLVEYDGVPLASAQRCWWRVQVWSADGRPSRYSEPAWFELGLLDDSDWWAEWIGAPAGRNGKALYFRRPFRIDAGVRSARAYVSGLGWHEFRLNGAKVGDHVLEPAQTEFSKRVLYTTYDIAAFLKPGVNAVGCIAGNGWYGIPKILVQLDIELEDGKKQKVVTGRQVAGDVTWSVADGPIVANSVFDGESYDARLERAGWDLPPANATSVYGGGWWNAMIVEPPGGKLVPQAMEPIKVIATRPPAAISQPKPAVYVFDSGQNLAGWVALEVQGPRGTIVTLRFAETIYEDGTVNQENLGSALATDTYILKGEGLETWEPRFTYHGFRYVQVDGYPGEPTLDAIRFRVVRSDVAPTGRFESSHRLVNQIERTVFWTESSNLHGLPTDCPQRGERMGWLNDMAARSEELLHTFDVSRLLPKWVDDIRDGQDPKTGAIADTAPFHWGSRPADPVSVCYLLIPWLLYKHYGDIRTAETNYDGMKAWVDYLTTRAPGHIVDYSHYGDWAPPIAEGIPGSIGSSAVAHSTPGELISTAHYHYSAALFAKIADVLGRKSDAIGYRALTSQIAEAFNRRFWDESSGGYGSNNQASNAVALYMGLVPPDREGRVFANLVADIERHDVHLTTGNLCTKYILEVLSQYGRSDLAFQVVTQTSYPSWGHMLARGATTMWERWEEATGGGMNSHNHPMYASVGSWLYRTLGGIRLHEDGVGFSRLSIAPFVPAGMSSLATSLQTVRGLVRSSWEIAPDHFKLAVQIPPGATAEVRVPKPNENPDCVLTAGRAVVTADSLPQGVASVRKGPDAFHLDIGPGEYEFAVEMGRGR